MTVDIEIGDPSHPPIARPRLLIDGRAATSDGIDPGYRLLGLTLLERTARAARRSGYGRILVLANKGDVERFRRLLAAIDDVHVCDSIPERDETGAPTVCVPGLVVGEPGWLAAAAASAVPEDGSMSWRPGVTVCGRRALLAEAAAMAAAGQSCGTPVPPGSPLTIGSAADLRVAEKRLLRSLVKSTDGFMARRVERPISIAISRVLAPTPITPNQVTIVSVAVGLAGAPFFLSAAPLWQTIGALLFLAHSILDGCDGELSRLRFEESRWGGVLDFWGDNIVHVAIFGSIALGWSLAIEAAWPLALGAAALFGTIGSASFVYWRVMGSKRGEGPLYTSVAMQPAGRLAALLDSLSRRDFIYALLIVSLFGKASWFIAVTAVGTPSFFIMVLIVAARERRASASAAA